MSETRVQYGSPVEIVDVPHITMNLLEKFNELGRLMEATRAANFLVNEASLELDMVEAEQTEIGYAQGHIEGKTVADRDRRQTLWLGRNGEYQAAFKRLQDRQISHEIAKQELELASKELGVWHSIAHVQAAQLNAMATGL